MTYRDVRFDSGLAPMTVVAGISILVLLSAIGWSVAQTIAQNQKETTFIAQESDAASADTADISFGSAGASTGEATSTTFGDQVVAGLITNYLSLEGQGMYTPEVAQSIAQNIGAKLATPLTYAAHTSAELKIDADTSSARLLVYRSDLRTSLAPLLRNQQPEFAIFAAYIDSKDPQYLEKLRTVAADYREAIAATAKVAVPRDAVPYHIAILNAMEEFAATLDSLATNADDPFASTALLKNYNQAEADMLSAFNALITYEKSKS